MNNNVIYDRIECIRCSIKSNEEEIVSILEQTETYKTAKSEIDKSIFCLENIDKQISCLQDSNFAGLCVFLPMNQPLYSLILFAVIPGLMFTRVVCRPPILLSEVYEKLFSVLNLAKISISCACISRRDFCKQYVESANAIIYTGQYENAIKVMQSVSTKTIFIFQGSAANPIIITPSAEVTDILISKIIYAQTYNSGQDCMAPSAIFVSRNNWLIFLKILKKRLDSLLVGEYRDELTDIAPMIEEKSLNTVKCFFEKNKSSIIYGGYIDFDKKVVQPTIIHFSSVYSLPFVSSYSPTFCLYCYDDESELIDFLSRSEYQENKAYVSVFGESRIDFSNEIVISDDILDSVDDGYSEFGGYGKKSGFVSYNGVLVTKPILISRELAKYRNINGITMPIGDLVKPVYESTLVLSNMELTGKSVLEIGCGTIPHGNILASYCRTYIAVDTNRRKVIEAMNNASANLSVYNMNGTNLEFDSQKFDVAFLFHCLHEVRLDEQGAILKEIHRVLKENGRLLIIETISRPESDFQKCFNIVHEEFTDYKHIHGVEHTEWVISAYLQRGFYREITNETHTMTFLFSSLKELIGCLMHSFMYEIEWDDILKAELTTLLTKEYGNLPNGIDIQETITFRILEKITNNLR